MSRKIVRNPAEAFLHGHVPSPTVAVIDMISVPVDLRRQGIGGRMYRDWEMKLPAIVTTVHLWAGNRTAVAFWTSQGFVPDRADGDGGSGWTGMSKDIAGRCVKEIHGKEKQRVP